MNKEPAKGSLNRWHSEDEIFVDELRRKEGEKGDFIDEL